MPLFRRKKQSDKGATAPLDTPSAPPEVILPSKVISLVGKAARQSGDPIPNISPSGIEREFADVIKSLPPAFHDDRSHTVLGYVIACDKPTINVLSPEVPYCVITIADLDDTYYVPRRRNCKGILRLSMSGIDPASMDDLTLRRYRYAGKTADQCSIRDRHLKEMRTFLARHLDRDISMLVIQCPDGWSRSLPIAVALCDGLGLDRNRIEFKLKNTDTPFPESPTNKYLYDIVHEWSRSLAPDLPFTKPLLPPSIKGPLSARDSDFPVSQTPEATEARLAARTAVDPSLTGEAADEARATNEALRGGLTGPLPPADPVRTTLDPPPDPKPVIPKLETANVGRGGYFRRPHFEPK